MSIEGLSAVRVVADEWATGPGGRDLPSVEASQILEIKPERPLTDPGLATVLKRPKVPEQLLAAVNAHGGAIVSASECSRIEIMQAQDRGDYAEDFRGFGFVRRTPEWLERVELKQTYIGYGGRLERDDVAIGDAVMRRGAEPPPEPFTN